MKNKKKGLAIALAAAVACGCFAGCDLITTDSRKDFLQVIATVDITRSDDFSAYKDVIEPADILKRDMVASYVTTGYSIQNTYGWSYYDTFNWICESLVSRQINIQYAIAYFLENEIEVDGEAVSIEGFKSATQNSESELAALEYFLDKEEEEKALYSTYRLFNNTLDSQEPDFIKSTAQDSSSTTPRTLPTGVNTDNSDYYDPAYRVYTGSNALANCGSYEPVEGSTPTSRKKAYNKFLSNLRNNDLLQDGEKTSQIENLSYFSIELKSAYESAIITKLGECFEAEAEAILDEDTMLDYYNKLYNEQKAGFSADKSTFESALDSVSDSNFLLTAPEAGYGFVLNILLPFSATQSAYVSSLTGDYNDPKGNAYRQRASVLEGVLATDQRASWFTAEEDYSFEATDGYPAGSSSRNRLFFEDSLNAGDNTKYEPLKNYYGKYTYNGDVYYNETTKKYTLAPAKINIDTFIDEMEGYLDFAGKEAGFETKTEIEKGAEYFNQTNYYDNDGKVNYENFVYYAGKVQFKDPFDANNLFVSGTQENTAFSVINELSFAYNTDTAGLNSYLGYSVVTGKTSYVGEFEYAAQEACKKGAGAYYVVPSDYGWHIIYCTFSFVAEGENAKDVKAPFAYSHDDALNKEGSFSNLFYESVKATIVSSYTTAQQTTIINAYNSCKTVYEDRYADLTELDS